MKNLKVYKNTLDDKTCEEIIGLYKSGCFKNNPEDNKLKSIIYSSETTNNNNWNIILEKLKNLAKDKIKDYLNCFNLNKPEMYTFSHAGVNCLKDNKSTPYHYDIEVSFFNKKIRVSHFAVLIYLNENFDGGDLIFPMQDVVIKPEKGMMVIFPTSFLYPHGVSPVFIGERYMVRMTYVLNKDF